MVDAGEEVMRAGSASYRHQSRGRAGAEQSRGRAGQGRAGQGRAGVPLGRVASSANRGTRADAGRSSRVVAEPAIGIT